MTTLMRSAAFGGGDAEDVQERLEREISNFGFDYYYIRVAWRDDYRDGDWFESYFGYESCIVDFEGSEFKIRVYMR